MSSSSSFLIGRKTRQLEQAYLEELLLQTAIWYGKWNHLKLAILLIQSYVGGYQIHHNTSLFFTSHLWIRVGGCRRRGQVWIHSTEDMTKVEHKQVTVSFLNATFPFHKHYNAAYTDSVLTMCQSVRAFMKAADKVPNFSDCGKTTPSSTWGSWAHLTWMMKDTTYFFSLSSLHTSNKGYQKFLKIKRIVFIGKGKQESTRAGDGKESSANKDWVGRGEGGSRERGHVYTYSRFTLMWQSQHTV